MAHNRTEPVPPPGALGELVAALRELHTRAGRPSRRKISHDIRQRHDLRDTVSHETVSAMLRGDSRPSWLKYETVVRYLSDFAVYQPKEHVPDRTAILARFHRLWLACEPEEAVEPAAVVAPLPDPEPDDHTPHLGDEIGGDPPPRNTRFIGREHQLRAIQEVLRTGAPFLTLTGFGGVGKTQLAAEYMYRFRDEYDLVWWVPAEHTPPMRAALAALGTRLSLPHSGAMQHPPAQVLEALSTSSLHWLLVFDNAGAPRRLPLVRDWGSGKLLLTSRDPDWVQEGPTLDIGVFEREESIELLRMRAANIATKDANTVAEKVGDLPLAVDQVANWYVTTGTTVATFLDRLDQQAREILSDQKAVTATYPVTLAGALTVAFEQLTADAPAAAQLLEIFAWLGAEPVSLALFRRGRHGEVTEPLGSALRQEHQLNRAVRELRRRGLINVLDGHAAQRVQMHRLFQNVLRDWLGEGRLTRGRDNLRAVLAAANPGEPDDPRFWPHYNEVGPHVHGVDLGTATDFEVRRVGLDQARYLFKIGHYDESMALSKELAAVGTTGTAEENRTDADHQFHILANLHLANAMRMLGRYAEAGELTEDSLAYMDRHAVFDTDHELRVILNRLRGLDLRIAGRYEVALALDIDNHEKSDPDDHESSRINRNNMAVNYRLLGRFAKAREIDEETVREWEQERRRERDPRTLLARCNLARDLYGLGEYRAALSLLRETLPIYREVVGEQHAGVLLATRTRAMALRKLGEIPDAVRLARQNHRDTRMWFGEDHEYTLAAGLSLVNAQLADKQLGNATVGANDVLDGYRRLFGESHPATLAMLVNSAAVLRALGDLREAHRRDEHAMTALSELLGEDHPYTLCAHHNFAVDLTSLGHEGRALDEFRAVHVLSREVRGDAHPDHLACEIDLALTRSAIGGADAGRSTLVDAVARLASEFGPSHPHVLSATAGRWLECDVEPPAT